MTAGERRISPYYLLLAGVLLQGLSPVFTKLLLEDLSEATVIASRYLLALALFMPVAKLTQRPGALPSPRRRDWIALFFVGFLGSGIAALLFTWALTYSAAGVVHALSKTAPLFVVVFAYLALQERVTTSRLALVGVMIVADVLIGAGDFSLGGPEAHLRLLGDLLALAAGFCRAVSEVLAKGVLRRFNSTTVGAWRVGTGLLVAVVAALATGGFATLQNLDAFGWTVLLALALVSTVASLTLYYRGLSQIPVHVAVTLKLVSVVVTVVVSWVWLGEVLNLYHLAGVTLLLAGAHLLVLRSTRRPGEVAEVPLKPLVVSFLSNMRARLTALAGLVIIVVVVLASYLMGKHAVDLVRHETRLAMSNVAVTVLGSVAAQPQAPPAVHERFFNNLVRAELQNQVYSVDVVYALLQDQRGVMIAAAYDEQALPLDQTGTAFRDHGEMLLFLSALSTDPALARRYGLIVVQATLEDESFPMTVTLGCARRAAGHLISQIIARHIAVAALIILTALASLWLVLGRATQPVSEVFRALNQVSRGRLYHPVVSRSPDEVGQVAESVDQIRLALLRGRQWREAALRLLNSSDLDAVSFPRGLLYLAIPRQYLPPASAKEASSRLFSVLEKVLENNGSLEGQTEDYILASWGRSGLEQDDILRAMTAGLAIATLALEDAEKPQSCLISSNTEAIIRDGPALTDAEVQLDSGSARAYVWVDAEQAKPLASALAAGDLVCVGEQEETIPWVGLTWGPSGDSADD